MSLEIGEMVSFELQKEIKKVFFKISVDIVGTKSADLRDTFLFCSFAAFRTA